MLDVIHSPLRLQADPARVVVRPFHIPIEAASLPGRPGRVRRIADAVLEMNEDEADIELELVLRDFEARHWQTRSVFMTRYAQIETALKLDGNAISEIKKQLIGAYFCHEYSYAAAALMNPSVIPHPDQSGLSDGAIRIAMSLRAVGEGHISSIAFREGILGPGAHVELMPEPPFATAADSAHEVGNGAIEVHRHKDSSLSGTVLFPMTAAQSKGLEDMRLVEFTHDDGRVEWIGTYTAYNGAVIRSELLRTSDFRTFTLAPMSGPAARNKGMALFPRKVGGDYLMIGRQDGENVFIIRSDRIDHWGEGELLLTPKYPWEMVQLGNCGSPIEIDEGWLLLTHGVGAMRKYSVGAILLDKDDPSKVLGRMTQPLLSPADEDREGYVPNVVYSCGGMRHGDLLFLPYGVADSSVAFAFVPISSLVNSMR
ncbi:glycoside hydrolase family 130 protein [Sphingomonas nostoxanthinifaciens]|uniref:glycoside hydrolase family 130 protein n=1 Tax=Sphingomonas nostoxanthinifaciens TaxID=2872652 RepID=UPI001CC215CD|nr:glycoside hydrolase family 130 protein [Sphingomonas nostoxanthinifaciens]UAK25212.1 glycoside hydrolase family 130 protein [Sphingomonas nostoxanthinifaciens]